MQRAYTNRQVQNLKCDTKNRGTRGHGAVEICAVRHYWQSDKMADEMRYTRTKDITTQYRETRHQFRKYNHEYSLKCSICDMI